MDGDALTAKRYRERAEQLRAVAKGMRVADNRETLLAIAETYEHLAKSIETIANTDTFLRGQALRFSP